MRLFLSCLLALAALPATSQTAATAKAPHTPTFTTLYTFTGEGLGFPSGGLILDTRGNLYGAYWGQGEGVQNGGVFELSPVRSNWTLAILYAFPGGSGGRLPLGDLIFDAQGNLYGTAYGIIGCGTENECGTVFELSPDGSGGWQESTLYTFQGGEDGINPGGALVLDASGNLYGTTIYGGGYEGSGCYNGCGTVFELSRGSSGQFTESILYRFGSSGSLDLQAPLAPLVFDAQGNLYGAGLYGGLINHNCLSGCGGIFELSPGTGGSWTYTPHFLPGGDHGGTPESALTFSAGKLYGTTFHGGVSDNGVIFELTPSSNGGWKQHVLHSFQGDDGSGPEEAVIFDAAGNMYGITSSGGTEDSGVAYKLTPSENGGWSFGLLYNFTPSGEGAPGPSNLAIDSQGHLFGATYQGGTDSFGTVFTITP